MTVFEKESPVDLQERLIRRAWEDAQFAELLRTNPRAAIAEETGVELPVGLDIQVHAEDEATVHLVIPVQLQGAALPQSSRRKQPACHAWSYTHETAQVSWCQCRAD